MNKSNKTNVSQLTKMTITPLFFEQIEKFQSLKISTTQGLAPGTLRLHMATCHVHENVAQSY